MLVLLFFQDLFFHYRWNNFLHAQVEQCVALALRCLGGGDDGPGGIEAEGDGHNSQGSSPGSPPASLMPQSPPSVPAQAPATEQGTASDITSPQQQECQPEAMDEGKEIVEVSLENADTELDTKDISPLVFNVSSLTFFISANIADRILFTSVHSISLL
jgi:hypothetical protein